MDPRMMEALNAATRLQLFQLSTVIERLLADPRRILAVRVNMNLGQTVRFLDWRNGQMRSGTVIAMKDTQVIVREQGTEWKLPYAAVEPPTSAPSSSRADTPSQPKLIVASRKEFRPGDKVSFTDRYLQPQVGTISRVNQKTATVNSDDGNGWRVPFHMLRHVLDL